MLLTERTTFSLYSVLGCLWGWTVVAAETVDTDATAEGDGGGHKMFAVSDRLPEVPVEPRVERIEREGKTRYVLRTSLRRLILIPNYRLVNFSRRREGSHAARLCDVAWFGWLVV
ncbi:hypothetical protein E2542_SST05984 [Spatholobus suberectus]|nr:hypothetical protein E2542_SST05984 [Spatholobus suberectus]